jgi:hypothetical protein
VPSLICESIFSASATPNHSQRMAHLERVAAILAAQAQLVPGHDPERTLLARDRASGGDRLALGGTAARQRVRRLNLHLRPAGTTG